ncbi:MAG: hypothetical protein UY35_C0006G0026 [Candidatus Saccharibacteria bacterium GW2011_GWC2_48_9]|nr:MAG: hypothetical protein UY35_C0006G0026 [Candidatus Saccharibacteria bacterium GW2011_GWC2_48_9]
MIMYTSYIRDIFVVPYINRVGPSVKHAFAKMRIKFVLLRVCMLYMQHYMYTYKSSRMYTHVCIRIYATTFDILHVI